MGEPHAHDRANITAPSILVDHTLQERCCHFWGIITCKSHDIDIWWWSQKWCTCIWLLPAKSVDGVNEHALYWCFKIHNLNAWRCGIDIWSGLNPYIFSLHSSIVKRTHCVYMRNSFTTALTLFFQQLTNTQIPGGGGFYTGSCAIGGIVTCRRVD